jgi:uncharacterized protein (DUF885 family)
MQRFYRTIRTATLDSTMPVLMRGVSLGAALLFGWLLCALAVGDEQDSATLPAAYPSTATQLAQGPQLPLSRYTPSVDSLAKEWLAHQRQVHAYVRLQSGLSIDEFDPVTLQASRQEARFNQQMLRRLDALPRSGLPHEQWLLAMILRHALVTGADAEQAYWLAFSVTPYAGGDALHTAQAILATQSLKCASDRHRYLHLLSAYAVMLEQIATKTRQQADRGIRVPKAAIPGVIALFHGLQSTAGDMLTPGDRLTGIPVGEVKEFETAVKERITARIEPAYQAVASTFNADYVRAAPDRVGLGQWAGGKSHYLRLIEQYTGLKLTPAQIHDLGERRVAELEQRMAALRQQLGFKGSREDFHQWLRTDPRFLVRTPQELEDRYKAYVARIEPHLPEYFSKLPQARFDIRRLDPAAEQGQTWGYYSAPTAADPVGHYYYNAGADLAQRSQVWAAHLIYHEIIPGHHLQLSLQLENSDAHPARKFLDNGAFTEGWAEYAASLAEEMGAYEDPYDLYGHWLDQAFKASRLVVDTGMNYFGMSLEDARAYMKAHTIESDAEIASDTLRYSTDLYAQALCYDLGYETFWELRHRAERALGPRFDIREFHAAAIGEGAMPLDVLDQHIDWFIEQRQH